MILERIHRVRCKAEMRQDADSMLDQLKSAMSFGDYLTIQEIGRAANVFQRNL
jgi:hypothetical protein